MRGPQAIQTYDRISLTTREAHPLAEHGKSSLRELCDSEHSKDRNSGLGFKFHAALCEDLSDKANEVTAVRRVFRMSAQTAASFVRQARFRAMNSNGSIAGGKAMDDIAQGKTEMAAAANATAANRLTRRTQMHCWYCYR